MRNLKKMLSLVMALAMLASFMVVGASAAKFNDDKDIVNTDAVNTLVALGVIKGYEDGSFNPTGTVTRAEMAKMLCVVMNGGRDPQLSAAVTNFKDVPSTHWAAGYIAYCVNTGYVAGYDDGTFKPDATVTGTQAAKMLLTAIGFSAESEGYVGSNWAINVEVRANERGLYDGLGSMNPSVGLTRDNAAQMIYNGVQANMVEYNYTPVTEGGQITLKPVLKEKIYDISGTNFNDNILHNKFDMVTAYGYMVGHSYDSVKEKYTYTFDRTGNFGGSTITTVEGGIPDGTQLTTATDYTDMYGMKVKVMYKNDTNKTVFGVYARESSVTASGVTGDIGTIDATAKTVKVDGTAYKVSSTGIAVYNKNVGVAAGETLATLKDEEKAFSFTLVDNNGDSKADAVIKTPMKVAKISYVSSDSITVGSPVSNTYQIEDIEIYESFAKNDWVYVTASAYAAKSADTFVKAELKNGTVEGAKSSTDYKIDGTWFTKSTVEHSNTTIALTDTIEYVTLGSMVYYSKVTESGTTTKDIAMVISADQTAVSGTSSSAIKAKLLFTDGTSKVVGIAKVNGANATFTAGSPATGADNIITQVGTLVTYKVNSDGDYELTSVPTSGTTGNLAGYKGAANGVYGTGTNKAIGGYELADDAIVFVLTVGTQSTAADGTATSGNKGKIYTGRELKNAYGATTFGTTGACLYGTVNGFNYGKVAVITGGGVPTINTGSNYGYLTSGAYNSYENGKTYINYTFWTAEGKTVEAKEESTNALTPYAAGALITYDTVDATTIKNVTPVIATTSVVTGWDDSSKIQIAGLGSSKIDANDTVVIYIDSANKKGANGSIVIGEDTDGNDVADQPNIRYKGNNSIINLLVVDVKNKMVDGAPAILGSSATAGDIATAFTSSSTVTLSATTGAALAVSVPMGKTLNITAPLYAASAITLPNGAVFQMNGNEVVGPNALTGTTITVTEASGGAAITASADVTLNGYIKLGTKDSLKIGANTLKGTENATLIISADGSTGAMISGAVVCANNFYTVTSASPSAGSAAAGTYKWVDVDTDADATTMGWLLQA